MKLYDLYQITLSLLSGDLSKIKNLYALAVPLGIPRAEIDSFRDYSITLSKIEVQNYVQGQTLKVQEVH